eukprot:177040-Hanusia_phi.AAC.5
MAPPGVEGAEVSGDLGVWGRCNDCHLEDRKSAAVSLQMLRYMFPEEDGGVGVADEHPVQNSQPAMTSRATSPEEYPLPLVFGEPRL